MQYLESIRAADEVELVWEKMFELAFYDSSESSIH